MAKVSGGVGNGKGWSGNGTEWYRIGSMGGGMRWNEVGMKSEGMDGLDGVRWGRLGMVESVG